MFNLASLVPPLQLTSFFLLLYSICYRAGLVLSFRDVSLAFLLLLSGKLRKTWAPFFGTAIIFARFSLLSQ